MIGSVDYEKTLFNLRWFLENMLYIINKDGLLQLFKLNDEQSEMLEYIMFCLENEIPVRIIVLKARQIGSTTFFAGIGFWLAMMNMNQAYGIVAHRLDSSESIFQKCKVFYNNLPKELQPSTTQMSGEGITFDKKSGKGINSKIKFATVNEGVFRGQTFSYLHLSENAFWDGDVRAVENSLASTVPYRAGTIVVRESTANGYNHFKDRWDRAVKGITKEKTFFFPWHTHKEYRMAVPVGFTLTEEEERLKEKFGLDDEQVMWRRFKIEADYDGNVIWFAQENPMTPEEAFVASGGGVFEAETIMKGYDMVREPKIKKAIESVMVYEKLLIWEKPVREVEKVYQQRAVWSDEKQDYEYIDTDLVLEENVYIEPYTIGVDTAGLGSNFNQIVVVKNRTDDVVARFGIKTIKEEDLAKIVVEVAKYYNNALVAPETNYSHEICEKILDLGYKNLYITENIKTGKVSNASQYGWKTTQATKAPMISALRTKLNERPDRVPDREFWDEAEYYLLEDPIKLIMNAASGHNDDIIIATAIAMYVANSFQAKKSRIRLKTNEVEYHDNFILDQVRKVSRKAKMRKGMFTNNA